VIFEEESFDDIAIVSKVLIEGGEEREKRGRGRENEF